MKILDKSKQLDGRSLFCALFLLLLANHVQALTPALDLGTAGAFNGFVLGNMTASNSDIEGRLAVGGNLSLNNYSIGMELADSNGTRDDLIAGGTLNFTNGRVYNGNARSGGVATIAQSVGFYNDNNINDINGSYIQGNPLDFASIGNELKQKSTSWGGLSSTGTTLTSFNNIELKGSNSDLNIFSLTSDSLSNATKFLLDIPKNSWALINVSGLTIDMSGFGFFRMLNGVEQQLPDNQPGVFRHDGSLTQRVLFNMFNAETLNLNAIGVKGSILAPNANTNFYNGHIDGNLIVGALGSPDGKESGQINLYPFISNGAVAAPVPLPSMFIPVLMLLAGFFKQQIIARKK